MITWSTEGMPYSILLLCPVASASELKCIQIVFFASAALAQIPHAFTREHIKSVILHTIAITGKRENMFVRMWLSAGRGTMNIDLQGVTPPNLFCLVHDYSIRTTLKSVHEYSVGVPLKPALLANAKSNNYLLNALVAMEAQSKGGYLGLQMDSEGKVTEAATANIAIVDAKGYLRTPKFHNILRGTTVSRALENAQKLVDRGLLKGVEQGDIYEQDLYDAKEMLTLGGHQLKAVTSYNDKPIGVTETDGPGPVALALFELESQDLKDPRFLDDIPYHLYEQ